MTSLDLGLATLRSAAIRVSLLWEHLSRWLKALMPKGLYARSLIIIVAPMVILQSWSPSCSWSATGTWSPGGSPPR